MISMQHTPMSISIDDTEMAAAVVAVLCAIDQQSTVMVPDVPGRSLWAVAAALEAQSLPPTRCHAFASWRAAERAARASRWSYGITGF